MKVTDTFVEHEDITINERLSEDAWELLGLVNAGARRMGYPSLSPAQERKVALAIYRALEEVVGA